MDRVSLIGLAVVIGCSLTAGAAGQDARLGVPPPPPPDAAALPPPLEAQAGAAAGMGGNNATPRVKPLMEGPLHEAFLSPRKDREPAHVVKAPPPPVAERPGIDPPSASAEWIEGYWEWDANRNDFVWVTGTWRVPPPGRFWVNGYWKRDDKGWYRVPGFWSDRRTDRIDYRKNGPPQERPDDDPGEPPARRLLLSFPGSTIPTATASPGRRASGPRSSPAGRGCRPSGSVSPTAGCFRTATGTARSTIAVRCSPPPTSTRRARGRRPGLSAVHQGSARDVRPAQRCLWPAQLQLRRLSGCLLTTTRAAITATRRTDI